MFADPRWQHPLLLWTPVVLCMLAIFTASSLPDPPMPSGTSDKWLHAIAYCGLTSLLIRAYAGGEWSGVTARALLLASLTAVAYGASDEWHQSFVATRHAELGDLGADAIGAAFAAIGVWACSIIRRL